MAKKVKTGASKKIVQDISKKLILDLCHQTLHINGIQKWGFATIYSHMRTMMTNAEIHENLNTGLWNKCVATATKLENIMVNSHEEKCAYGNFYDNMTDYEKYLKTLEKWELYKVL